MSFWLILIHTLNITFGVLFLINLYRLPRRSNPDR